MDLTKKKNNYKNDNKVNTSNDKFDNLKSKNETITFDLDQLDLTKLKKEKKK